MVGVVDHEGPRGARQPGVGHVVDHVDTRGRDDLDGSKGADRLVGGPGADWLWSEDGRGGNDAVYGGRGIDAAFADRGDLVRGVP